MVMPLRACSHPDYSPGKSGIGVCARAGALVVGVGGRRTSDCSNQRAIYYIVGAVDTPKNGHVQHGACGRQRSPRNGRSGWNVVKIKSNQIIELDRSLQPGIPSLPSLPPPEWNTLRSLDTMGLSVSGKHCPLDSLPRYPRMVQAAQALLRVISIPERE